MHRTVLCILGGVLIALAIVAVVHSLTYGQQPADRTPPSESPDRAPAARSVNLAKNPLFQTAAADPNLPAHYRLQGDVEWTYTGRRDEFADWGIALYSGKDLDGDGTRSGFIAQDVSLEPGAGRWFRFSFRGLAENNFAVTGDDLSMKVEFYSQKGTNALDGVTRKIYPLVERDRRELAINGNRRKGGGAVWKTYALDFKIPFPEVDQLRLIAGFRNGSATTEAQAAFYLTEFSLVPIAEPAPQPGVPKPQGAPPAKEELVALGGHWYYRPQLGEKVPSPLTVDFTNTDRLFYRDNRLTNPFAENMTAWLRKGYLDREGRLVPEDRFVTDNVTLRFEDGKTMIVHAKNLPNHPTAEFPERFRGNPSYIQEHDYTYYLPLEPVRNPRSVAMDKTNSNRALPMGAIGIAINGVVFYNPFDAGGMDATDMMDRCCGHPSPDNRYHYHKYPVCVKSPFVDEGEEHSPLIGWAFDGFPIYGPYESKGVMAKDYQDNPLNDFNIHYDEVHGWHYHVTPGQYPYVIGGYWGEVDPRNRGRGGRGPGGRPPGGD
jgi:hypothetical protein